MNEPRALDTEVEALQARLRYRFRDGSLLERALTHRSWAFENGTGSGAAYERLEFLGDALLGFLVSEWLWRDDPEAPEGVLTRRKQSVVRTESLTEVGRRLELGAVMRLGRGEAATGGRDKASLLADVVEAVLGAIYLDGGVRAARAFVRRELGAALRAARASRQVADDFKTLLQERVQAGMRQTPRYRIVGTIGPAHAHEFEVEVLVGSQVLARGSGPSRKQAEQQAARAAMAALPAEHEERQP